MSDTRRELYGRFIQVTQNQIRCGEVTCRLSQLQSTTLQSKRRLPNQSLRHSPLPRSSRPPSVPVKAAGAQDDLPTMGEDLALIDPSLPDEARAFLERMVGCAEIHLQSEIAAKICTECPSFVRRSNSEDKEEELARRTPLSILGTYSHLAIDSHDLQGNLGSLSADNGGTNLRGNIGDGDRVGNGSSNDDLIPRAFLATSSLFLLPLFVCRFLSAGSTMDSLSCGGITQSRWLAEFLVTSWHPVPQDGWHNASSLFR